jgi:hypothetical protein
MHPDFTILLDKPLVVYLARCSVRFFEMNYMFLECYAGVNQHSELRSFGLRELWG